MRGALSDVQDHDSLFGFHPHGILAVGFSFNGCWSEKFRARAGTDTQFLIDGVLRESNPAFKVLADCHGGLDSLSKKVLFKNMGQGRNVAFIPGGFEDATAHTYGTDRTVIKKRTGFIKYALQHGYRVHPVYTFGECNTFYAWSGLLQFRLWLNTLGIPAIVPCGVPFTFLPFPVNILSYVGEPIELPKIAEPSKDEVEKWHRVYMEALVSVYDKHKEEAGLPATAKLEIW